MTQKPTQREREKKKITKLLVYGDKVVSKQLIKIVIVSPANERKKEKNQAI